MQVLLLVLIVPKGIFNSSEASFCVNPLKYNNSITDLQVSPSLLTNSFNPIPLVLESKLSLLAIISTKKSELRFCLDCLNFFDLV